MAECYYFDENGYMAAGTTLPDGSNVNHWGAWNINGTVITRSVPVDMGEDSQNSIPASSNASFIFSVMSHLAAQ